MTFTITPADVGRTAVCRNGDTVTVEAYFDFTKPAKVSVSGRTYTSTGGYYADGTETPYDLIAWADERAGPTPVDTETTDAARKQRRETDEKLANQRHEINWLKEQQASLKAGLAERDAEISRLKTVQGAAGVLSEWLRTDLTDAHEDFFVHVDADGATAAIRALAGETP